MKWFENPRRHGASDMEDLAYSPAGGWLKMVLLGVGLAVWVLYFAVRAWVEEEAIWFGRGGDVEVYGHAARAMAVVYASVGMFCHFRWFWGLLPVPRVYEVGTIISLLGLLGGLGFSVYYAFT